MQQNRRVGEDSIRSILRTDNITDKEHEQNTPRIHRVRFATTTSTKRIADDDEEEQNTPRIKKPRNRVINHDIQCNIKTTKTTSCGTQTNPSIDPPIIIINYNFNSGI